MINELVMYDDYVIRELDAASLNLHQLSRFVVTENYKRNEADLCKERLEMEINELYLEEKYIPSILNILWLIMQKIKS